MASGRKRTRVTVVCQECGKEFDVIPCKLNKGWGKYCSNSCKHKNIPTTLRRKKGDKDIIDRGVYLKCIICGETFRVGKYRKDSARFCSRACKGVWHGSVFKGKNHPNWDGGHSTEDDKIRKTKEYKDWRDAVYRRDNWSCVTCGTRCKRGNVIAHHVFSFRDYPLLRFDVNNGITMCKKCHLDEHRNEFKDMKSLNNENHWTSELRKLALNANLKNDDGFVISKSIIMQLFGKNNFIDKFRKGLTPQEAFDNEMDFWNDAYYEEQNALCIN
jgi:5-methylcytosine-specific restriction endonuclease McrA